MDVLLLRYLKVQGWAAILKRSSMLSISPNSSRSKELLEMLVLDCFLLMAKISFEFKIQSDYFFLKVQVPFGFLLTVLGPAV